MILVLGQINREWNRIESLDVDLKMCEIWVYDRGGLLDQWKNKQSTIKKIVYIEKYEIGFLY